MQHALDLELFNSGLAVGVAVHVNSLCMDSAWGADLAGMTWDARSNSMTLNCKAHVRHKLDMAIISMFVVME